jgi:hypothetical protein
MVAAVAVVVVSADAGRCSKPPASTCAGFAFPAGVAVGAAAFSLHDRHQRRIRDAAPRQAVARAANLSDESQRSNAA